MLNFITNCDWTILNWVHANLTSPLLDTVMPKITLLGNEGILWIAVMIALLISKKYRRYGVILGIGLLSGVLIGNLILKNLIARPRPCWIDTSVTLLIPNPTDYSFPSGHTLSSAIAAVILTCANRKFGIAAIPLAILIAFSRLYLYVHFPSDIIGGAILGLIIAAVVLKVNQKFGPMADRTGGMKRK
ncbi:MAG: phosphatase PAP2 family protein [Lachnospiraceae bacterium]